MFTPLHCSPPPLNTKRALFHPGESWEPRAGAQVQRSSLSSGAGVGTRLNDGSQPFEYYWVGSAMGQLRERHLGAFWKSTCTNRSSCQGQHSNHQLGSPETNNGADTDHHTIRNWLIRCHFYTNILLLLLSRDTCPHYRAKHLLSYFVVPSTWC